MRHIPNYVDDPPQFLLWEIDEFFIVISLLCIGLFTEQIPLSLLCALLIVKSFRRLKDRQHAGFLLHLMYWHLGMFSVSKYPTSMPLSFIKRFF